MKTTMKLLLTLTAFGYAATSLSMDTSILTSLDQKRSINFANTTNSPVTVAVHTTAETARIPVPAGEMKKLTMTEDLDANYRRPTITVIEITRQKGNKTKVTEIYEQKDLADSFKESKKNDPDYANFHYPELNDVQSVTFKTQKRPLIGDKFIITTTLPDNTQQSFPPQK